MSDSFVPFAPPSITQVEIDAVVDTLRGGWLTTGPKTKVFEQRFAQLVDAPAALALSSCTAGLHVALAVAGVGPGDEVITTPLTFAASVNVIEHVGATPVLVDVDADTLNIDPRLVEAAVGARTRAIVAVHYAGHPADLDPLLAVANAGGLLVVEDAAHAVGAEYRGRRIGSGDNPTAFSFYATKNMTTGEGGMLTGSLERIAPARKLALHGLSRDAWDRYGEGGSWQYEVVAPGFKYNMTDVQAALGLSQIERFENLQARRGAIVTMYREAFADEDALELPTTRGDVEHAWHLFVVRLRSEALTIDRDRVIDELRERGIGTSVHFIPIHLHPYYRDRYGWQDGDFPVAVDAYRRMVSLPLSAAHSDAQIARVIDAVKDVLRTFAR